MQKLFKNVLFLSIVSGLFCNQVQAYNLSPMSFANFYHIAEEGDLQGLHDVQRRGLNINATNQNGDTAICVAIKKQDYLAYKTLIRAGAQSHPACLENIPEYAHKAFLNNYNQKYAAPQTPINWTKSSTAFILGAGAAAGVVALAAGGGGGGGGGSNSDSKADETPNVDKCSINKCAEGCFENKVCSADEICTKYNTCGGCTQCEASSICRNNKCAQGCYKDLICSTGYTCEKTNECGGCESCVQLTECQKNACAKGCYTDLTCPTNYTCSHKNACGGCDQCTANTNPPDTSNATNCLNYDRENNICTACEDGYKLVNNGCQIDKPKNCKEYEENKEYICKTCEDGYDLSDNGRRCRRSTCTQTNYPLSSCPNNANCESCQPSSGSDIYKITNCKEGYSYDIANNTCTEIEDSDCTTENYPITGACPVNGYCNTCTDSSGNKRSYLLSCSTNYMPNSDRKSCVEKPACTEENYPLKESCPLNGSCDFCTDTNDIDRFKLTSCATYFEINETQTQCVYVGDTQTCPATQYPIKAECPKNATCGNVCTDNLGEKHYYIKSCADTYQISADKTTCELIPAEQCTADVYPLKSCPENGTCASCYDGENNRIFKIETCNTYYEINQDKTQCVYIGDTKTCSTTQYPIKGACPENATCGEPCTDSLNEKHYSIESCADTYQISADKTTCELIPAEQCTTEKYPLGACPENGVCSSCYTNASEKKYKLESCQSGYDVATDSSTCEKICSTDKFPLKECPDNALCNNCTNSQGTSFNIASCKNGLHLSLDGLSCNTTCNTNTYNLTTCPDGAFCEICTDDNGSHFQFSSCLSGYTQNGTTCTEQSELTSQNFVANDTTKYIDESRATKVPYDNKEYYAGFTNYSVSGENNEKDLYNAKENDNSNIELNISGKNVIGLASVSSNTAKVVNAFTEKNGTIRLTTTNAPEAYGIFSIGDTYNTYKGTGNIIIKGTESNIISGINAYGNIYNSYKGKEGNINISCENCKTINGIDLKGENNLNYAFNALGGTGTIEIKPFGVKNTTITGISAPNAINAANGGTGTIGINKNNIIVEKVYGIKSSLTSANTSPSLLANAYATNGTTTKGIISLTNGISVYGLYTDAQNSYAYNAYGKGANGEIEINGYGSGVSAIEGSAYNAFGENAIGKITINSSASIRFVSKGVSGKQAYNAYGKNAQGTIEISGNTTELYYGISATDYAYNAYGEGALGTIKINGAGIGIFNGTNAANKATGKIEITTDGTSNKDSVIGMLNISDKHHYTAVKGAQGNIIITANGAVTGPVFGTVGQIDNGSADNGIGNITIIGNNTNNDLIGVLGGGNYQGSTITIRTDYSGTIIGLTDDYSLTSHSNMNEKYTSIVNQNYGTINLGKESGGVGTSIGIDSHYNDAYNYGTISLYNGSVENTSYGLDFTGIRVDGNHVAYNMNGAKIEIKATKLANYGNIYGIQALNGATALNMGTIKITSFPHAKIYGMHASGNSKLINRGVIEISHGYGMYAEKGSTIENSGTIIIGNTQIPAESISTDENGNTYIIKNTTATTSAAFYVDKTSKIVNRGNITFEDKINTSNLGGGEFVLAKNGKIEARKISGKITAADDIVVGGFDKTYTSNNAFIGDASEVELGSGSALFDASIQDNNIVMKMKKFDDVITDKSFAAYLQHNYETQKNAEFFDMLKKQTSVQQLNTALDQQLGYSLLPNFAQENMNVFRSLSNLVTDNMFSQDLTNERMMVGYDYLGQDRSSKGRVTGYENTANSSYFLADVKLNNRQRFGLGAALTRFDSDYDDSSSRKATFAQALGSYMHDFGNHWKYAGVARLGYADGKYKRQSGNSQIEGNTSDILYGLNNEMRYTYDLGFMTIEPQLELNASGYYQNKIKEDDSKASAMIIKGTNNLSVESGAGVYIAKETVYGENGKIKGRLGGSYYRELSQPYHTMRARIRDMDGYYLIESEDIFDRNRVIVRADITFSWKALDFYLRGSQFMEDKHTTVINAGIKYNF